MLLTTYILLLRVGLVLLLTIILVLFWLRGKVRSKGGSLWVFVPYYGRRWAAQAAKKQLAAAEAGRVYNEVGDDDPDGKKFKRFLRDLPVYCIEDSLISNMVRGLMKAVGVRYVQEVFIDKSEPEDKYCWVRKDGMLFVHDKGTYASPWKSVKNVDYRDIADFRPLIDMTEDMDWRNPEMCADVVTAITNTRSMKDIRTDKLAELTAYVKYALGGLVVLAIGLIIIYSRQDDSFKQVFRMLSEVLAKS